jgi:hypothetical protein
MQRSSIVLYASDQSALMPRVRMNASNSLAYFLEVSRQSFTNSGRGRSLPRTPCSCSASRSVGSPFPSNPNG